VPMLMVYYGMGALGLVFVFSRFYKHALNKKVELGLNTYELRHTEYYKRLFTHLCFIPIISIVFVLAIMFFDITIASIGSGILYALTGVVFVINQRWLKKVSRSGD